MFIDSSISETKLLGNQGENAVAQFLIQKKFRILEKNYRIKSGEIDIIAQKKDLIVFVEVKTRKTNYFNLSQIILESKQHKIISAARHYIFANNLNTLIYRFDVALVELENEKFSINYIENAFQPTE